MCFGLTIWSIALLIFSVLREFWQLALIRLLTGLGEACFMSLAPTILTIVAPPARKTCYLGLLFAMLGVGTALGFIYGQLVA